MGLVIATTVGLCAWIVLWAIGWKSLDAFLVTTVIVTLGATRQDPHTRTCPAVRRRTRCRAPRAPGGHRLRPRRTRARGRGRPAAAATTSAAPSRAAPTRSRSTPACRCRAPTAPRARDMVNAIKLALQEAGGKVGPFSDHLRLAGLGEARGADVDRRQGARQRPPGGPRPQRDRLHRRPRLGRHRAVGAADQRGPHPAGQPVEHVRRADPGEPPPGRARALLSVGRAHVRPRRARRPRAGLGADRLHEGPSACAASRCSPTARSTAAGIADEIEKAAARQGITVYDRGRIDALKDDLSGPARKVAETGADAFLFAGTTDTGAAAIFKAVAAAAPAHAAVRPRRRRRPAPSPRRCPPPSSGACT